MSSAIASYQIETDTTVLVEFADGKKARFKVDALDHHLAPGDVKRIRKSFALRRNFLSRHMPKAGLILVVAGLVAVVAVNKNNLAEQMSGHQAPAIHVSGARPASHLAEPTTPQPTPTTTATPAAGAPVFQGAVVPRAGNETAAVEAKSVPATANPHATTVPGSVVAPVAHTAGGAVKGLLQPVLSLP